MSEDMEHQQTNLQNVWRTCNKIRSAIFRIDLNLWSYFKPLDPNNNTLISESKFVNILSNKLRGIIGLSNTEIEELTDYFRVQDGRIFYHQFCNVIHSDIPDNSKNDDLVSGLEWEDPLHVNRISESEHRRLCVLLTKIAQSVRLRELVLRPYFQDYELISKNNGTVTFAHFSRVLHFLGILLSSDDFQLLLKRFIKDSYTINYVCFLEEIEKIVNYLDTNRMIDYAGDFSKNFPGRLIDAELPKLPRPEIGRIRISDVFGKETSFHPALNKVKVHKNINEIILRIQRYVMENRIRIHEFFQDFDPLRSGFITKSQFLRGIDAIGISGLDRMYLSDYELENLCEAYQDELDCSRIDYLTFEDVIDRVFTIKNLDKKPYEIVVAPPRAVAELPRDGSENWQQQTSNIRDLCEEAVQKVKDRILKRRLFIEPMFKVYDIHKNSHVTRSQMRQVLAISGCLLSDEEVYALEKRYNDDMGFNYMWFLKEADPKEYIAPKFSKFQEKMTKINCPTTPKEPKNREKDIIQVVAKIKGQVVRKRIRIIDFMKDFDHHSEQCICDIDFRRGLDTSNIKMSVPEVDLICEVFKSPLRQDMVDYRRFCQVIEEAFYQPCLERAPLIVPLQHFPSDDSPANFLNFDERTIVTKALQKLARKPDQISNLSAIFKDYDAPNCGTISQNQFLRALTVRDLHNIVSSREIDVICKCFGIERGMRLEVDYRSFLNALEILFATKTNFPF